MFECSNLDLFEYEIDLNTCNKSQSKDQFPSKKKTKLPYLNVHIEKQSCGENTSGRHFVLNCLN